MDPYKGLQLSKHYWEFYDHCMKSIFDKQPTNYKDNNSEVHIDKNKEYENFIAQTRKHQAERNREKASTKEEEEEIHYQDVSRIDMNNDVEIPERSDPIDKPSAAKKREQYLIELYGDDRNSYEHIRSIEMSMDEYFCDKKKQLQPQFWPVMPINMKPYFGTST